MNTYSLPELSLNDFPTRSQERAFQIAADLLSNRIQLLRYPEIVARLCSSHPVLERLRQCVDRDSLIVVLAGLDLLNRHDRHTCAHVLEVASLYAHFSSRKTQPLFGWLLAAAVLHDLGKLAIPESVLTRREKLTEDERAMLQTHPEVGYLAIRLVREQYAARPIRAEERTLETLNLMALTALLHHIKLDGGGYPVQASTAALRDAQRRTGILEIALWDMVHAMMLREAYRSPLTSEETVEQLKREEGALPQKLIHSGCSKVEGGLMGFIQRIRGPQRPLIPIGSEPVFV